MVVKTTPDRKTWFFNLDENYTLRVYTREINNWYGEEKGYCLSHIKKQWWLVRQKTPVVFMDTMVDPTQPNHLNMIGSIEVRERYRRQGLSRRIVKAVEKIEKDTLWSTGSWTPLGGLGISWMPVLPWETGSVKYRDQNFVCDWDNYQPTYPL